MDPFNILQELNKILALFTPGSATSREDEHTWHIHEEAWKRLGETCSHILMQKKEDCHEINALLTRSFLSSSSCYILNSLSLSIFSERTKLSGTATECVPKLVQALQFLQSRGSGDCFSFLDSPGLSFFTNNIPFPIILSLLKLCGRTNRVFVTRAVSTIELLIKLGLPASMLFNRALEMASNQSKAIRQYASHFVLKFLEEKNSIPELEMHLLVKFLLVTIIDPSQDVRLNSTSAFKILQSQYPDDAKKLIEEASPHLLKVLQIKTTPLQVNQHLPNSPSITKPNSQSMLKLQLNIAKKQVSVPTPVETNLTNPPGRPIVQVGNSFKFGASVRICRPNEPVDHSLRQPVLIPKKSEIGPVRASLPRQSSISRSSSPLFTDDKKENLDINSVLSDIKSQNWQTRSCALLKLEEFAISNTISIDKLKRILPLLLDIILYDKHAKVVLIAFENLNQVLLPYLCNTSLSTSENLASIFILIGNKLCDIIVKAIQTALARGEHIAIETNFSESISGFLIKTVSLLHALESKYMESRAGLYLLFGLKSNSFLASFNFRATLIGWVIPLIVDALPIALCNLRVKSIIDIIITTNVFSEKNLKASIEKMMQVFSRRAPDVLLCYSPRDYRLTQFIKSLDLHLNRSNESSSVSLSNSGDVIMKPDDNQIIHFSSENTDEQQPPMMETQSSTIDTFTDSICLDSVSMTLDFDTKRLPEEELKIEEFITDADEDDEHVEECYDKTVILDPSELEGYYEHIVKSNGMGISSISSIQLNE